MKVLWTQTAIGHLAAIHHCIAQDSPPYARRMVDRITARISQMDGSPNSGQRVPAHEDPNIRSLIEGPYRVLYKLDAGGVQVLALLHASRELPADLPPTRA
jgi:plasmid stabilization system protein ParE